MTANYKLDAMLELRKFLWNELKTRNIFDEEDYWSDNLNENIIPIVPVQQTAEMNQFLSGKKHIVYDKIGMSYEDNWLICCEQILFTIYSTDFSEINEIRNFMTDQFRRMDESARDINWWSGLSDKFKFHAIFVADISPTEPSEELQGFFSTDVILEIKYSRITDSVGRFA
jgi:dynactin complex subunit